MSNFIILFNINLIYTKFVDIIPILIKFNSINKNIIAMKRFVFLWSSLLLALVILSYVITIGTFFSIWFFLLTIPSFFMVVKLIKKIGKQVIVLTRAQKSELSSSVYCQGYMALFVSLWCGFIISRHPYEHCIYATTFGVSLLCFFILCIALRNYLNSFSSL